MRQKIHWSPQPGKLACRRKLGDVGTYRGTLSAREFVAKHKQSPDLYCAKCARIADKESHKKRPAQKLTNGSSITLVSSEAMNTTTKRGRIDLVFINEAQNPHGATFTAAEVVHLRALAEYLARQFVGTAARKGLDVLKGKLS